MYIVSCIVITLLACSASSERAFLKLKIIKNRLKCTMSENRFEELIFIACVLNVQFNTECIIKKCSSCNSVLTEVLIYLIN